MAAEKIKKEQITKRTGKRTPRTTKTELIIKTATEHPDLTTREIGAIADCSHVNVITTLRRYGVDHAHLEDYRSNRADILSGLQHRLLVSITDADINKTPVGSRVLAVAQLYDKERLERGQSTSNISYLDVSKRLQALVEQKKVLLDQLKTEHKVGTEDAKGEIVEAQEV
jgi:hypothetical protein